jgi:hypothetical protein
MQPAIVKSARGRKREAHGRSSCGGAHGRNRVVGLIAPECSAAPNGGCQREAGYASKSPCRRARLRVGLRHERARPDGAGFLPQQAITPDRRARRRQRLRRGRPAACETSAKAHSRTAHHHRPEHAAGREPGRCQLPLHAGSARRHRDRLVLAQLPDQRDAWRPRHRGRPRFPAASARCGTPCRSRHRPTCSRAN